MSDQTEYFEWARSITDPKDVNKKPEALDGIRVIDISTGNFGALFCSSILAELGAEVIRVEPPGGDICRKMTPEGRMHKGTGLAYLVEGRNKFHITLNLEKEEGKEILKKLVKKTDVLIESFRPGDADEMGIGYTELKKINESLIYVAFSSTGQFGSEVRKQYDYDIIDQAISTVMSVTGEAEFDPSVPNEFKVPLRMGNWMGWYTGGAWGAYAILIALFYRLKTGKGQYIDISPGEALLRHANYNIQYYHESGRMVPRVGPYDPAVFAYTIVKAKDRHVFIAGYSDINWKGLTNLINRPDLFEKYPTPKERLKFENQIEMRKEIQEWAEKRTSNDILKMATEYSIDKTKPGTVVVGCVYSPKESSELENWYERDILKWFTDPYYGKLLIQGSSFGKMSETPGRIKWCCKPPGADNTYIYTKILGFDAKMLRELKENHVI